MEFSPSKNNVDIEQAPKVKKSVDDVLDILEAELRGGQGSIPSVEFLVDKKSFSKENLRRIAKLPIELFFGHDENMEVRVKTGFSTHVEFESGSWAPIVYGMQLYTAHNHPGDTAIPSFEDLVTYSKSDSFYHFILSESDGVSVIRKPTKQEIMDISKLKYVDFPKHEDFLRELKKYLIDHKIIERVVKFEDSEMDLVAQMFRGDLSVDYFKNL